ncbi:MAG: SDR family oxidoreductase [Woeseiaceae bacterium]|nr:SDR family oxidoreductase [Woeseiaceae bacterium]
MGMNGQVALVVGGTGDIGTAICRGLAAAGAKVIVSGLTEARAAEASAALDDLDPAPETAVLDVTDGDSCKAAVAAIVDKHERLDCLVNTAGVSYIAPILLGNVDEWRRVLEVNTLGAFTISQAVLRPMIRARYGRIVHIGSISAEVGAPYNAIYAASKAGVAGLVRSLSLEVAASGVTVNAVQPGYVKTKLFAETQGARARIKGISIEEQEDDLVLDTPTRRLVTPEDVASIVTYLAAEESRSITGQTINVDGGRTAN